MAGLLWKFMDLQQTMLKMYCIGMQSQSDSSTVKIKLGNGIIVGYYCALVGTKMLSN